MLNIWLMAYGFPARHGGTPIYSWFIENGKSQSNMDDRSSNISGNLQMSLGGSQVSLWFRGWDWCHWDVSSPTDVCFGDVMFKIPNYWGISPTPWIHMVQNQIQAFLHLCMPEIEQKSEMLDLSRQLFSLNQLSQSTLTINYHNQSTLTNIFRNETCGISLRNPHVDFRMLLKPVTTGMEFTSTIHRLRGTSNFLKWQVPEMAVEIEEFHSFTPPQKKDWRLRTS